MTSRARPEGRELLDLALQPGLECIPLERLGEPLQPTDRTHLESCPRCQAELALWTEVHEGSPAADDGAAVQWVAAEVRRRRAARTPGRDSSDWRAWPTALMARPVFGLAAVLALVVTVVYVGRDREPAMTAPASVEQYRGGQIRVIAPAGDVVSPPGQLQWVAIEGAARYDVTILEVDRTVLWRGSSITSHVALPPSVVSLLVPGKTLLWDVTAIDKSGAVLAASATQRFRVPPRS